MPSVTAPPSTLHPAFAAKYVLGDELGSGGFGFVMSATERLTGTERAVKFIYKAKVPASAWVTTRSNERMPMEIYVLKHVRHPNVVRYIDSFEDSTFFYLVMELHGSQWISPPAPTELQLPPSPPASPQLSNDNDSCDDEDVAERRPPTRRPSCDLFECIEQHRRLDESLTKKIFRQIIECVAYLDNKGVCHRDIKDENIVIDSDYNVKLIDFGSAVLLPRRHNGQPRKACLHTKFFGTVSFAAPEILQSKPYQAEPAEIWALGVLLYTMLFGEVPFANPAMAIAGRFAKPKVQVSVKCLHLIHCMLAPSAAKRPTIHQVLAHPWLRC
ncbi:kinase-like domain-containing protein [Fennellomyces sp. T-0311]|nr:kinase-like domain-containing protein [Fennellomyces sp. T-0311]